MSTKKKAQKKLHNYEEKVRRCGVTPRETVYTDLYSVLQILYAQKKYELVTALCDAAILNM